MSKENNTALPAVSLNDQDVLMSIINGKTNGGLDAECMLVGDILVDFDCMEAVDGKVTVDDFHIDICRKVFELAITAYHDHTHFDASVAAEKIKADGGTQKDFQFLVECMDVTPTAAYAGAHAEEIKARADKQRLVNAMMQAIINSTDPKVLAGSVYDICGTYIQDAKVSGLTHIATPLKTYLEAKQNYKSDAAVRINTGLEKFDDTCKGFCGGELIVLAARTNVGKTAFAIDLAKRAAQKGFPTAIYSMEMTDLEVTERFVAACGPTMNQLIDIAQYANDAKMWEEIARGASALSRLPIYIDDTPRMTVSRMRSSLYARKEIRFVIVDYITLMQSDRKFEKRYQEVGAFTRELKMLAKELGVPILALAQVGRGKDSDAEPTLRDLRESGDIEQDANKVIFLHNTKASDDPDAPILAVTVAKNRRGGKGTSFLTFDGMHMRFFECEKPAGYGERGGGREYRDYSDMG